MSRDRQRTVLVVDDEPEIRDLACMVLGKAGYGVKAVESGEAALEEALERRPDLVLLDVNMPGMDGWEVLRLLKIQREYRDLPVVMFTIKMETKDKVHALQDGAYDYITKPFAHDELLDRIGRIFERIEVSP